MFATRVNFLSLKLIRLLENDYCLSSPIKYKDTAVCSCLNYSILTQWQLIDSYSIIYKLVSLPQLHRYTNCWYEIYINPKYEKMNVQKNKYPDLNFPPLPRRNKEAWANSLQHMACQTYEWWQIKQRYKGNKVQFFSALFHLSPHPNVYEDNDLISY